MAATTTATGVRTFDVDKSHSEVTFQVRHLLTKVRGRFSDFTGTIAFDEAQPEQSSVAISIQAASIDTNEPNRDTHLRSDDFFAVDKYPTLAFTSTQIAPPGNDRFDVTGDLTIRGVTKRDHRAGVGAGQGDRSRGATRSWGSRPSSRSIARSSACSGTRRSRPAASWSATT